MSGKRTNPKITIGSGTPYIMEYTGTMPSRDEVCKPENLLGKTKSGAAVNYSVSTHTESDDLGTEKKTVITAEDASLKLGLITFNGKTLAYLADRCRVEEKDGIRTVYIGGTGNAQGKEWVVCFHHEDKKDGDCWVMIRGNNTAALALSYAVDAGTKLEPEFTCLPQDDKGTLITYIEQIGTAAAAE